MSYLGTIGIEIHVQLKTKTKLFCGCSTQWSDVPNQNICEICVGHPGSLPRLNKQAIIEAIRIIQALGMEIASYVRFDRKHYFYPDLSKNYQTSQFYSTLGKNGSVQLQIRSKTLNIRIREAHLEEDAARLTHVEEESMIDFNRGGVPLLEIVTEPDFHIGEEVEEFLRYFQLLSRTINASDANMELGQLRCDANVSISKKKGDFGTRVELKNISSPRFLRQAIDHEISRQTNIINSGGVIDRETRRWNENRGKTESMRSKEMALDYRYLFEPDLQVIELKNKNLDQIRSTIPELPLAKVQRFISEYKINKQTAIELVSDSKFADFFENCTKITGDADLTANWILNQVKSNLNEKKLTIEDSLLSPARLAKLLKIVKEEGISTSTAKQVLKDMFGSQESPSSIIRKKNLGQISDISTIQTWVEKLNKEYQDEVEELKQGNRKIFHFLLGKIIDISKGKVNPRIAKEQLQEMFPLERLCVIDMGGAISAERDGEGVLSSSEGEILHKMINNIGRKYDHIKIDLDYLSHELSENISPREWFSLYEKLRDLININSFKGIVITHGLDTMSYTASFIYWIFPYLTIPIIFTGATKGPEDESSDAQKNLSDSIDIINNNFDPGVWIRMGGKTLHGVNFQMIGIEKDCMQAKNIVELPSVSAKRMKMPQFNLNTLEKAISQTMIIKVYPGLDPKWIESLVKSGIRYLILELFDTGTANTRWGTSESLLPLIQKIRSLGGAVFGTSQLGIPVNATDYESSRALWNAGIVPLGRLISESAFTKLIAAQLITEQTEQVIAMMIDEEFSL